MPKMRNWIAEYLVKNKVVESSWRRRSSRNKLKKIHELRAPDVPIFKITQCNTLPGGSETMTYLTSIKNKLIQATWNKCYIGDLCSKPSKSKKMFFCEGCLDWLHYECISKDGNGIQSLDDSHWMCDVCRVKYSA